MALPMIAAARRLLRSRAFRLLLIRVGPMLAAQATNLARHGQWRQLAILHADSLTDGMFSREVLDDGAIHWVVWRGDRPVAAYPTYDGALATALEGHDPSIRKSPHDLPTRKARATGAAGAQRVSDGVGRFVGRQRD